MLRRLLRGIPPNRYPIDDGSYVEYLNLTQLRYHEGGRSILIDSELLADFRWIAVHQDTIRNWETPPRVNLDAAERARVLDRVREGLERGGMRVEVV